MSNLFGGADADGHPAAARERWRPLRAGTASCARLAAWRREFGPPDLPRQAHHGRCDRGRTRRAACGDRAADHARRCHAAGDAVSATTDQRAREARLGLSRQQRGDRCGAHGRRRTGLLRTCCAHRAEPVPCDGRKARSGRDGRRAREALAHAIAAGQARHSGRASTGPSARHASAPTTRRFPPPSFWVAPLRRL
jgi:hypothetical protein